MVLPFTLPVNCVPLTEKVILIAVDLAVGDRRGDAAVM